MFKYLIVGNLILVLVSLASGIFFLAKDEQQKSNRLVTSLTIRISLSISLIILLIIGYFNGLITPHNL